MKEIFNTNFSREKPVSRNYNFPEVFKEFQPDFVELIKKLKNELDKGTYGILISDEVGGRIPTLAIREVAKQLRDQELQTVFLPGGRKIIPEETIHQIIFNKSGIKNNKSRALLVSEYAKSGETVKALVEILDKEEIFSDIAVAISSLTANEFYNKIEGRKILAEKLKRWLSGKKHEKHEHKIFIGRGPNRDFRPVAPAIDYEAQELAGVYKNRYSMEIIPFKSIPELQKEKRKIQENIKKAREDVKILAEKTIEKVWGSDKSSTR